MLGINGRIARIKPNYYLHDTVVPRRMLPEVLRQVYERPARRCEATMPIHDFPVELYSPVPPFLPE